MNRIKTILAALTLVGAFALPSCAAAPATESKVLAVSWWEITPPRSGLRCWYSTVGQGASYCEPDPAATHGATP